LKFTVGQGEALLNNSTFVFKDNIESNPEVYQPGYQQPLPPTELQEDSQTQNDDSRSENHDLAEDPIAAQELTDEIIENLQQIPKSKQTDTIGCIEYLVNLSADASAKPDAGQKSWTAIEDPGTLKNDFKNCDFGALDGIKVGQLSMALKWLQTQNPKSH
jgi:hypothetical protein